ncbi:fructosamine kinase family protein [Marinobacter pelagius]|uniref:fructosamine kinase family protein n=1 Tax=Marinobacter sp. C7 TaxID=2951363 RepID=UPI001EEF94CB|nr:fructosamine kinase family protein [Marinobacter sp. C7]MCG7199760.1 fructosamine kinase family protein [Marinobacter sp. C7]
MFTKHNTTRFADALICEAEGLESLRAALEQAGVIGIRVPEVLRVNHDVLEMTGIQSKPATDETLSMLGEGLALMHRLKQSQYGWSRDNYIGLSPQPNRWSDSWGEFFVSDRLAYQVSRIRNPEIRSEFANNLEQFGKALARWLDGSCEHPSLLHGDLWSGNALFDASSPWLIDPAVYCGDREADLAMTEMFGGFGQPFYEAYDRMYARTPEYSHKRDIYNLYHYLNHYNLFGGGYLGGCQRGFDAIRSLCSQMSP